MRVAKVLFFVNAVSLHALLHPEHLGLVLGSSQEKLNFENSIKIISLLIGRGFLNKIDL